MADILNNEMMNCDKNYSDSFVPIRENDVISRLLTQAGITILEEEEKVSHVLCLTLAIDENFLFFLIFELKKKSGKIKIACLRCLRSSLILYKSHEEKKLHRE